MMNNILIVLSLVLLCGCLDNKPLPRTDSYKQPRGNSYYFTTTKGLDCYYIDGGNDGGMSCNWEKFNKVK